MVVVLANAVYRTATATATQPHQRKSEAGLAAAVVGMQQGWQLAALRLNLLSVTALGKWQHSVQAKLTQCIIHMPGLTAR